MYSKKWSGIIFSHKKKNKEIPPFAATSRDLEGIVLSEISQTRERQRLYDLTCEMLKSQTPHIGGCQRMWDKESGKM